jgi:hypothetical protein
MGCDDMGGNDGSSFIFVDTLLVSGLLERIESLLTLREAEPDLTEITVIIFTYFINNYLFIREKVNKYLLPLLSGQISSKNLNTSIGL